MRKQWIIADVRWLALTLVAASALLLSVSCGGGGSDEAGSLRYPYTVVRADGQEVTFEGPPQRIVSLSPGHTEVLFGIGAGDQVVAVDTRSDFPAETEELPKFDALDPDVDALVDLEPDLVVVVGGLEDVVDTFDDQGLPVLWLEVPTSETDLLDHIDYLGAITGHLDASDQLVDTIDGRFLAALNKVGQKAGPRVYHELDEDLTTVSSGTLVGEMYLILNAVSIADDTQALYPQLTSEEIIEADPEVIVLAYPDASPESVKARPGWGDISAVESDRVFTIDPAIVNRPGPRLAEGLERLGELLHPDLFAEP